MATPRVEKSEGVLMTVSPPLGMTPAGMVVQDFDLPRWAGGEK
jgi:hypothetical protein